MITNFIYWNQNDMINGYIVSYFSIIILKCVNLQRQNKQMITKF